MSGRVVTGRFGSPATSISDARRHNGGGRRDTDAVATVDQLLLRWVEADTGGHCAALRDETLAYLANQHADLL